MLCQVRFHCILDHGNTIGIELGEFTEEKKEAKGCKQRTCGRHAHVRSKPPGRSTGAISTLGIIDTTIFRRKTSRLEVRWGHIRNMKLESAMAAVSGCCNHRPCSGNIIDGIWSCRSLQTFRLILTSISISALSALRLSKVAARLRESAE